MSNPPDRATVLGVEMVDALMVIAPRGWSAVQLKLERRVDGTPRVQELTTSLDTPGAKPALGLEVGAFHGVLNEALADIQQVAPEMAQATSVVVTRPGADTVELNFLDADGRTVAQVALDAAALDQLVFTEALYDALLAAEPELARRQEDFGASLVGHDQWDYDQAGGVLTLSKGVLPWGTFRAALIGSYAYESETWMWAWANRSFPSEVARGVADVRDRSRTERGMSALWRPSLPAPESFALRVAGLAALRMNARAIYGASYGPGVLMLALTEKLTART